MHAVCMWYTCGVHKTMQVQVDQLDGAIVHAH